MGDQRRGLYRRQREDPYCILKDCGCLADRVSQNRKDVRRGGKPEGATARPESGKNGGREEAGKAQPSQEVTYSDLLIPPFSSAVCTGPQDAEPKSDRKHPSSLP